MGNAVITVAYLGIFLSEDTVIVANATKIRSALATNLVVMSIISVLLLYSNDVTDRVYEDVKRKSELIESSTREKEAFFAAISHEIRNPLQSLSASVELLTEEINGEGTHGDKNAARLLEICKTCTALVINMVSNVLDMSKIAAGMLQLSPVPADLREVASRILRISRCKAEGKGIRIEFECDDGFPPAVEVDTQRVEQILQNLLSNAIKFTEKGRVVVKFVWLPESPIRSVLLVSSWHQTMELSEEETGLTRSPVLIAKYARGTHPAAITIRGRLKRSKTSQLAHSTVPQSGEEAKASERPMRTHEDENLSSLAAQVTPTTGVVKIEVMDTGIGISREGTSRLFRPYQQADASISRFGSR